IDSGRSEWVWFALLVWAGGEPTCALSGEGVSDLVPSSRSGPFCAGSDLVSRMRIGINESDGLSDRSKIMASATTARIATNMPPNDFSCPGDGVCESGGPSLADGG